eukprot:3065488-Rhodomonas_salina.1
MEGGREENRNDSGGAGSGERAARIEGLVRREGRHQLPCCVACSAQSPCSNGQPSPGRASAAEAAAAHGFKVASGAEAAAVLPYQHGAPHTRTLEPGPNPHSQAAFTTVGGEGAHSSQSLLRCSLCPTQNHLSRQKSPTTLSRGRNKQVDGWGKGRPKESMERWHVHTPLSLSPLAPHHRGPTVPSGSCSPPLRTETFSVTEHGICRRERRRDRGGGEEEEEKQGGEQRGKGPGQAL